MEISHLSKSYTIRPLDKNDVDIIYELSCENHIFYQYHPPFVTKESILEDIAALPPNKDYDDKFYIGFFESDVLIALMDLILDYPHTGTAHIGLFMVRKACQGQGIGSSIIADCAAYLSNWGYSKIRIGIDKGNPQSEAFWTKNAFLKTGEEFPNVFSSYLMMECIL